MLVLYSMPSSGNSYKVRLLLAMLKISYRHIDAEYGNGLTTSSEFLAKNPKGKVPLLELEDGRVLSESNAILLFLAEGTRFLPEDAYQRALVHAWLFFEQNAHETSVAVRSAILTYPQRKHLRTPEHLNPLLESGNRALGTMESQLQQTSYLVGDQPTVADICLYGYTHTAGTKGGFDMTQFPAISVWLDRIAALPGYVSLDRLPAE